MYGVPELPPPIPVLSSPTYKGMRLPALTADAQRLAGKLATDPMRARRFVVTTTKKFVGAYDGGGCVPSSPRPLPSETINSLDENVLAAFGILKRLYSIYVVRVDPRVSAMATGILDTVAAAQRRYRVRCAPDIPLPPVKPYGFIGTSMLAYSKMVPTDPQLTVEDNPPRLCLDLESEKKLQNQRIFASLIGGPSVALAGYKLKGVFGTFVMGLGLACTAWHYNAYKKVSDITGIK